MESIYLDNAATTPVAAEVAEVVLACMRQDFGNPSSAHRLGVAATERIQAAKRVLLAALGDPLGRAGELVFTSGGTEADALGVLGAARARARMGKKIALIATEHPAVLGAGTQLLAEGFSVTHVPVDKSGHATAEAMAAACGPDTVLLACMLVNNELGTINDVPTLAAAARRSSPNVHVHCDAVQALGKLAIDAVALGVDTLAVSSHKLYGPKGVGALWLKKGTRLTPLFSGGGQQGGLRSGTENVPGIAGFARATWLADEHLAESRAHVEALGARLLALVSDAGLDVRVYGGAPRVPHILSLGFADVPAEPLLHALEADGVFVSAGSACASGKKGKSHVLKAIGVSEHVGTLRVSFGRDSTVADVERAGQAIVRHARELRVDRAKSAPARDASKKKAR